MQAQDRVVITCYENPDLDGVACAFAYSEFLRNQGTNAVYALAGRPMPEVRIAARRARAAIKKGTVDYSRDPLILVDASVLSELDSRIHPDRVIEVIDHRKLHAAQAFADAKIQIDLVGAAATLIAEKFMHAKAPISRPAAALLAYAIASNTINFKASVTTARDRAAFRWLQRQAKITARDVVLFFREKSKISRVGQVIQDDMGIFDFSGMKVSIAQLEIAGAVPFVRAKQPIIGRTLRTIKQKNGISHAFLKVIDTEKGINVFYTESPAVQEALKEILRVKFDGPIAVTGKGIIMRKQLAPLLDTYFADPSHRSF